MQPEKIIGIVASIVILYIVFPIEYAVLFSAMIALTALISIYEISIESNLIVIIIRCFLIPLTLIPPPIGPLLIYVAFAYDVFIMLFVRMPRLTTMTHEFIVAFNTMILVPISVIPVVVYLAIICFVFTALEEEPVSNGALQLFIYTCGSEVIFITTVMLIVLSLLRQREENNQ